nr:uncharacterized protein LOC111414800 isoform X2 [Onthophagus taurus]
MQNKSRLNKREWRIFHTNNELSKFQCIFNHEIPIPKCDPNTLYALNMPLKGRLKNFYRAGYKGKKLQYVNELMRKIHKLTMIASKNHQTIDIFETIRNIIPKEFLGTSHHYKLYLKIVKKILSQSRNEHIFVRDIIRNYNFNEIPWLKGFNQKQHINYLYFPLIWSLDAVKYLIRKRFYFLPHRIYPFRTDLVPHSIYKRFKKRVINVILKKKYAIPINFDDVNKTEIKGVVRFLPKRELNDLKFRPIIKMTKKRPWDVVRKYCLYLKNYASNLSGTQTGQFYQPWLDYLRKIGDKKIYFVTVDVSDAFGRVEIDVLIQLIQNMNVNESTKNILLSHITNQNVTFTRTHKTKTQIYQWKHGLLQGDHFSGVLCNLYMSYKDSIILSDLLLDRNNFIHRTTDDYIFVSINKENVATFFNKMKFEYVLKLSKVLTNVEISKNRFKKDSPNYPTSDKIYYCGLIIDTNTKEVLPNFNVIPKMSLHGKFQIWNRNYLVHQKYFLIKSMRYFYNNNYFKRTFMNGFYNKPTTILDSYFKAMVNLAFKFDLAVEAIYNRKSINDYGQVIGQVVLIYAGKTLRTISRYSNKHTNEFKITFEMLVKVGYCAFYVVLRKRNAIYDKIIGEIRRINKKIFIGGEFNVKKFLKLPKDFEGVRMARTVHIRTQ